MVNKKANNENDMTTPDIPYLWSLKRESDGFANALHVAALVPGLALLAWMGLDLIGLLGSPSVVFKAYVRWAMTAWLLFFGLAALIDYTIFAVFRAFSEFLHAALTMTTQPAPVTFADGEPESAPQQRDPSVAYLHDLLSKRNTQANDDSNPLPPSNPAA